MNLRLTKMNDLKDVLSDLEVKITDEGINELIEIIRYLNNIDYANQKISVSIVQRDFINNRNMSYEKIIERQK